MAAQFVYRKTDAMTGFDPRPQEQEASALTTTPTPGTVTTLISNSLTFLQKNNWPDHKLECPYLRNYSDFRNQVEIQMIGNLILKLKGKDWKLVTSRIFDSEVSFNDLQSNADHMIQILNLEYQNFANPLESYIGKENMPDEATFRDLLGKVLTNRFGFMCGDPYGTSYNQQNCPLTNTDGVALFLGVSKLDHSCVPNACYNIYNASLTVRAIRTIKKFEKVTISYTNMISTMDAFLALDVTKQAFLEKCYCSDCSQAFGESKLTKILDASKAFGVLMETEMTLKLFSMLVTLKHPNPKIIVTLDHLKNLLKRQDECLGRTNLRRMQVLAILHSLHYEGVPKEERVAGFVELTESMKEVWGDYFPELSSFYRNLIILNEELNNKKEAQDYYLKGESPSQTENYPTVDEMISDLVVVEPDS